MPHPFRADVFPSAGSGHGFLAFCHLVWLDAGSEGLLVRLHIGTGAGEVRRQPLRVALRHLCFHASYTPVVQRIAARHLQPESDLPMLGDSTHRRAGRERFPPRSRPLPGMPRAARWMAQRPLSTLGSH